MNDLEVTIWQLVGGACFAVLGLASLFLFLFAYLIYRSYKRQEQEHQMVMQEMKDEHDERMRRGARQSNPLCPCCGRLHDGHCSSPTSVIPAV